MMCHVTSRFLFLYAEPFRLFWNVTSTCFHKANKHQKGKQFDFFFFAVFNICGHFLKFFCLLTAQYRQRRKQVCQTIKLGIDLRLNKTLKVRKPTQFK